MGQKKSNKIDNVDKVLQSPQTLMVTLAGFSDDRSSHEIIGQNSISWHGSDIYRITSFHFINTVY
jgi:hypothetical protein